MKFSKIFLGWFTITITYLLSFIVYTTIFYHITLTHYTDYHPPVLRFFTAVLFITIPYIVGGLYCRKTCNTNCKKYAFWISFVPVLGERIIIYFISAKLLSITLGKYVSIFNVKAIMKFIENNTLPHFNWIYVICGIISIFICMYTSCVAKNKFKLE